MVVSSGLELFFLEQRYCSIIAILCRMSIITVKEREQGCGVSSNVRSSAIRRGNRYAVPGTRAKWWKERGLRETGHSEHVTRRQFEVKSRKYFLTSSAIPK